MGALEGAVPAQDRRVKIQLNSQYGGVIFANSGVVYGVPSLRDGTMSSQFNSLRIFHGDFCAYFLLWVDWFCYNYFASSQVIAFG